jgi:hypothetical protein
MLICTTDLFCARSRKKRSEQIHIIYNLNQEPYILVGSFLASFLKFKQLVQKKK